MATKITPRPSTGDAVRDAFSAIQIAGGGADPMVEQMTLLALWRATPWSPELPSDVSADEPVPLTLRVPPHHQVASARSREGPHRVSGRGSQRRSQRRGVLERLRSYPTLDGGRPAREFIEGELGAYYLTERSQVTYTTQGRIIDIGTFHRWIARSPVVVWRFEGRGEEAQRAAFEALAPVQVSNDEDQRAVFPAIGGSRRPAFLALWWALLLALSSLVRYEPASWTAAVDPDRSKLATPLEQACDLAEQFVPTLLRDVLR